LIAIVGATVIDGNGGSPMTDATIVVRGKRIAAVGPRASISVPKGARVIDATGKYITQEKDGGKHVDHGTAVMKDGKACFTSAMDKTGEVCWTDPKLAEGQSGETTSDKGEKLTVTRVAYAPLTMLAG